MDSLKTMLTMQKALQENAFGYSFGSLTYKQRVEFIKEMSIHVNQELNEMLYELPHFKPWKDYSNITVDEEEAAFEKARKEYIDLVHFALNLAIGLDMTSDDIFTEYYLKNKENYARQVEGYTHEKSYRTTANNQ